MSWTYDIYCLDSIIVTPTWHEPFFSKEWILAFPNCEENTTSNVSLKNVFKNPTSIVFWRIPYKTHSSRDIVSCWLAKLCNLIGRIRNEKFYRIWKLQLVIRQKRIVIFEKIEGSNPKGIVYTCYQSIKIERISSESYKCTRLIHAAIITAIQLDIVTQYC